VTSARIRLSLLALISAIPFAVPLNPAGAAPEAVPQEANARSLCADGEDFLASTRGVPIRLCPALPQAATSTPVEAPPIANAGGPCNPDLERCEAWVSAPYDGPAAGIEYVGERFGLAGNVAATTMDGKRVFTAATSQGNGGRWEVATLAYDASNGATLWTERLEPTGGAELNAVSVVAGADAVFLTGYSLEGGEGSGFTRAYDAVTGATLWHRTFPGWANHSAISDDGARVLVAGDAFLQDGRSEARLVSYDAITGEPMWQHAIIDPKGRFTMPWRVDAAGHRVSMAVASVDLVTGATERITVATYDTSGEDEGRPVSKVAVPVQGALPGGIALDADGSMAFVAQSSFAPLSNDAPTRVLGIDTGAGEFVWDRYFLGWNRNAVLPTTTYPWHFRPIEVSPRGSVVLSTFSIPYGRMGTFVTTSLNPETGFEEWRAWEPATDGSQALGGNGPTVSVNPKTGQVVMTGAMLFGNRFRAVTYGYSATGRREWMRISNELPRGSSYPVSEGYWPAAVHSPDGTRVFEAGGAAAILNDPNSSWDVIVAAFDTAA
jgi:hypothetical protein